MKVDATVRDFRSGSRDGPAECTDYAQEVAEMALAHTIENRVERVYRRGNLFDKRWRIMDDCATNCARSGSGRPELVPIRAEAFKPTVR